MPPQAGQALLDQGAGETGGLLGAGLSGKNNAEWRGIGHGRLPERKRTAMEGCRSEKTGQKVANSCPKRLVLGPIWHQNALFLRGIVYSSVNRLVFASLL
jgi:hypothetical protein